MSCESALQQSISKAACVLGRHWHQSPFQQQNVLDRHGLITSPPGAAGARAATCQTGTPVTPASRQSKGFPSDSELHHHGGRSGHRSRHQDRLSSPPDQFASPKRHTGSSAAVHGSRRRRSHSAHERFGDGQSHSHDHALWHMYRRRSISPRPHMLESASERHLPPSGLIKLWHVRP